MGLGDLFQRKTNYFDKKITPKCGYCQFGKRTKEGNRILCSKTVNLKEESDSCGKFVYSPLKRVPVKQLNNEGIVADEEIYAEIKEEEAPVEKKSEAKNAEEKKAQEAAAPDAAETPEASESQTAASSEEESGSEE